MNIKSIIKSLVGRYKIILNRINTTDGDNYLGFDTKIVNMGSITLKGHVSIRPHSYIYTNCQTATIEIGKGSDIGNASTISCMNKIVIGNHVLTGLHVFISDHNHDYMDNTRPIIYYKALK